MSCAEFIPGLIADDEGVVETLERSGGGFTAEDLGI
jgi:hypothetical protein